MKADKKYKNDNNFFYVGVHEKGGMHDKAKDSI